MTHNIPSADKKILLYVHVKKMSVVQAAAAAGVSASTVRRRLRKYKDVVNELFNELPTNPATTPAAEDATPSPSPELQHMITTGVIVVADNDGQIKQYSADHQLYNKLKDALLTKDWVTANSIVNYDKVIAEYTYGFFKVTSRTITYNGNELTGELATRIIESVKAGNPAKPIMKFFDNLKQNPSDISVESAIRFITHNTLPITPDGCVLTYKVIKSDYKDCYTGKIDNSVGAVVAMPREHVTLDPEQTCSSGLHVCSHSYISEFGNSTSRLVVCKVDPRHIVSVPHDYNNAKMRVMQYEVIHELESLSDKIPDHYIDDSCYWYNKTNN